MLFIEWATDKARIEEQDIIKIFETVALGICSQTNAHLLLSNKIRTVNAKIPIHDITIKITLKVF